MIDEALLDDPDALRRADRRGDLYALASSGARVRTAARLADEAGVGALQPDGRPRTVLVAGSGPAALAGDLLAGLGGTSCPILTLRPISEGAADQSAQWSLPGWFGPLDLLLVLTPDGTEPGLTTLVEQAYARGCALASVAPPGTRLAEATLQARGLPLPFAPAEAADPTALWSLLIPALALADRIGLLSCDADALSAAADVLDEAAIRCRPDADSFVNPAKSLAVQLNGTVPLLWAEGPVAAAAAHRFAASLAAYAGRPALAATLPDALTAHLGLLARSAEAAASEDDFFRDRVEDADDQARPRILLLRPAVEPTSTTTRAQRLAEEHLVPCGELAATEETPLAALAELIVTTDFAAVYSGLGAAR